MAAMSDVTLCKQELASIADGGSIDPGGDARAMTAHFCAVLNASDLAHLQAELENELAARQKDAPTAHMNKHIRAIAVFEGALKVLKGRKKEA
jgi:hypothetical protein